MIREVAITCFIFCFGTSDAPARQAPVDSFCSRYEKQVITREDLEEIRKLPRRIRDRIQGNEVDYRCDCEGWNNPICQEDSD